MINYSTKEFSIEDKEKVYAFLQNLYNDKSINIQFDNMLFKGCRILVCKEKRDVVGILVLQATDQNLEIIRFDVLKKSKSIGQELLDKTLLSILKEYSDTTISIKCNLPHITKFLRNYGFVEDEPNHYQLSISLKYKYDFFLDRLRSAHKKSIILNPTENIPLNSNNVIDTSFLESVYVSESARSNNSEVAFGGRDMLASFFASIKTEWKKMLNAKEIDLKTLSGLHAHLALLSSILRPGDTIMLLPISGGGHYKTPGILSRLGATVIEIALDNVNYCVDVEATKKLISLHNPTYIFIDRSEGLIYEDFSWFKELSNVYKIFDASQYLTQILVDDYPNPFDMGFDMIVSSLHKNYPGPQKALFASKKSFEEDSVWRLFKNGLSAFMSSVHPENVVKSLIPYLEYDKLEVYIKESRVCILKLEKLLLKKGLPIIERKEYKYPALHLWIKCKTQEENYHFFEKLETIGLLVNYRLLPYGLGYGLRLGITAAVRSGLRENNITELADVIADAYYGDVNNRLAQKVKTLRKSLLHN